jgi:GDP-L-fucose synthase
MTSASRIYVAGAGTFLGHAIVRRLSAAGFTNVAGGADLADVEPEFGDARAVDRFFEQVAPEYIFVAAGKTAGRAASLRRPADLMLDNLFIAAHLMPAAFRSRVKKLLYLTNSCVYPRNARQPLQVSSLWTGALETSSAAFAVVKLAAMRLCDAYRRQYDAPFVAAITADPYGPGDDFTPENSHAAAALIRRMHEAKDARAPVVDVWGSGKPRREFIYIEDLADACLFTMLHYEPGDPINLGTGISTSIADLAVIVRNVVGYRGELRYDRDRPDGMPLKGLDSTPLHAMGWRPSWDLHRGLASTYESFLASPVTPAIGRSSYM